TPYSLYGYGSSRYGGYHPYHHYGYGSGYSGMRNASMYFARMRRLNRLINDLNQLTPGAAASASMTNRLRSDLMGVAQGSFRPPSPSVQKLSADLVSILPTRTV